MQVPEMDMIALDKTETGLPRAYNFPKLWAREWQKSSPRFLVSNPLAPKLCVLHGLFPCPIGNFSLILSSLGISSLECQYSLPSLPAL